MGAPGEQITESATAAAFKASRGPVREALKRLTQEGLLRSKRNRGLFVPILSIADVDDIYLLREGVEGPALDRLIARPNPEVIEKLTAILDDYEELLASSDWEAADELDLTFHRELVYSTGSPRLKHAFDTVMVETRMCLRALVVHHTAHPDMGAWDRDILASIEAGDTEAGRRALRFHSATVLADLAGGVAPTAAGRVF
ncbi:GntR family transcriptional regulator [Nocardioides sp. 31GB23]|uniref:GntR family transcriptional regulator n=1 Tax=Nocardioides sp. 31GB23 TaxID=3156065 RepID=UPI0032AEEE7A